MVSIWEWCCWVIQGCRREPIPFCTHHLGTEARGTGLTAVAVQEYNSDVLEVRLADSPQVLQVLLNQKALSFAEQNWMDLKGEWHGQA